MPMPDWFDPSMLQGAPQLPPGLLSGAQMPQMNPAAAMGMGPPAPGMAGPAPGGAGLPPGIGMPARQNMPMPAGGQNGSMMNPAMNPNLMQMLRMGLGAQRPPGMPPMGGMGGPY